ncbi:hypothetical protein MTR67_009894 [Solanum verrucosum]|uniref:Uncharacterized protein n=1 Tax=Solanum verrucosum TaxID=315347 RepID=A0AAF0TF93_SOLVR|nr:hypothetical protein MTR67_009894 [Solanum verrucosum]
MMSEFVWKNCVRRSYLDKRGQQPILIPSKKWSCLKLITNYYTTMLTTFKTGVGSATFIFKLQDHLPVEPNSRMNLTVTVTANSKVNTLLAKQIEAVILRCNYVWRCIVPLECSLIVEELKQTTLCFQGPQQNTGNYFIMGKKESFLQ